MAAISLMRNGSFIHFGIRRIENPELPSTTAHGSTRLAKSKTAGPNLWAAPLVGLAGIAWWRRPIFEYRRVYQSEFGQYPHFILP